MPSLTMKTIVLWNPFYWLQGYAEDTQALQLLKFEGKQWKYKKWEANQPNEVFTFSNKMDLRFLVPRLDTSEACQTLGVRLGPDGNNDAEYQHLWDVMANWKNHMVTACIPHGAVEFRLRQVLLPKLHYPLIATMFTEQQCQELMKLVLGQGLPAMGVNHHFPWAVAHSPLAYQGLNGQTFSPQYRWLSTSTPWLNMVAIQMIQPDCSYKHWAN